MNPAQELLDLRKSESNNSKDLKHKHISESPTPSTSSPKGVPRNLTLPNERDSNSNFSLPFRVIYDYHIKEIEQKTNLKIKHIYIFLSIAFLFFMIGHFERILSYIITGYFPIIWTIEDYKIKKDYFWKKWGTYWTIFTILLFFDLHKNEVLHIIPLYFIVKCIFLLMLYLPGFTIAVNIYDGFLKYFIRQIESYFQNKDANESMVNDLKRSIKVKKE